MIGVKEEVVGAGECESTVASTLLSMSGLLKETTPRRYPSQLLLSVDLIVSDRDKIESVLSVPKGSGAVLAELPNESP